MEEMTYEDLAEKYKELLKKYNSLADRYNGLADRYNGQAKFLERKCKENLKLNKEIEKLKNAKQQ